jgi:hypothetical protein
MHRGEPSVERGRLTKDMTEPLQPAAATDHARHDRELISALAARTPDLPPRDLAAVRQLVERCSDCRDLLADLVALQVALPTTTNPSRPRDFTITAADAERLRRGGWRRAIGFFGSARDGFSKPLAIGFTTIGLAALMLTVLPSIPFGGSGGAAVLSTVGAAVPGPAGEAASAAAPSAAPAAAPSAAPSAAAYAAASSAASAAPAPAASASAASDGTQRQSLTAQPYGTDGDQGGVFIGSNDADTQSEDGGSSLDEVTGDSGFLSLRSDDGLSLGVVIGGIGLILGFGLFALRWTARRFGDE